MCSVNNNSKSLMRILFVFYRISYISLVKATASEDFYLWTKNKGKLNLVLNKYIIKYLLSSDYKNRVNLKKNDQILLDNFNEIVVKHYRKRLRIYNFSNLFPIYKRNVFIILSFFYSYKDEIIYLTSNLLSLRQKNSINFENLSNTVDLSIGFPEHAFNICILNSELKKKYIENNYTSSFGEYLFKKEQASSKISHINIDEYVRQSKKDEKLNDLFVENNEATNYKRKTNFRTASFNQFITSIYGVIPIFREFFLNVILDFKHTIFSIIITRKKLWDYKFGLILKKIDEKSIRVRRIFILPYDYRGMCKYDNNINNKFITFNYSHNITIPPTFYFTDFGNDLSKYSIDEIFSDISMRDLSLTGASIGFTSTFTKINDVKKRLNKKYNLNLMTNDLVMQETPIQLGFEKEITADQINQIGKQCLVVFDVPVEEWETSIPKGLMGNRAQHFDVIKDYLNSCFSVAYRKGFSIAYKPKYSILKSDVNKDYISFIKDCQKKYDGKLFLIDPYINIIQLIMLARYSINIPYTSTYFISKTMNIPSTYYLPSKYINIFKNEEDIVYGEKELSLFIS